jgi:hypothetical protein
MEMVLVGASQAAIGKAAQNKGLALTARQVRDIALAERSCLYEHGRVSFGEGAAARLVNAFAASPFILADGDATTKALVELTEAFYELRENYPATVTDEEIVESLAKSFDGEAAGDVGLAATLAAESLLEQVVHPAYTIADDEGRVYHYDAEEWRENVYADGWYGERWEDADE